MRVAASASVPAKKGEAEDDYVTLAAAGLRACQRGPPEYDASALAREVFADPYFYNDNPIVAEQARENRETVFGPDTTVGQVRRKYMNEENRFLALAEELDHCAFARVVKYFAGADVTIEERLAGVGIVTLEASDEIPRFKERRIEGDLPSARRLLGTQEGTKDRQYRLCFVTGSSGSGKTFFALQNLRDFRNALDLPSFTLYVAPKEFMSLGDLADRGRAPKALVDKMKDRLIKALDGWKARYGQAWDGSTTLKMHVCVVLDEAGGNTMRRFFEDKDMVTSMLLELRKANIAESVMVAVVSAGLTAQVFDSNGEAYFFRIRPWVRDDVKTLLDSFAKKKKEQLILKPGESTTRNLANAMYSLPLLEALTTNGRAAYYMVNAIARASRNSAPFCRQEWRSHLSQLVPSVVDEVVFSYIASSGIRDLSDKARRRVAAWVLGSLSRLTLKSVELPQFEGLDDIEAGKALMLLQLNVQLTNGALILQEDELYSASVTPALAIVLFNMVGVFAGILAGWRGEEEVAALYAAQQAILTRFRKHVRDLVENKSAKGDLVKQFDESLAELCVNRLQKQIQSNKLSRVNIPIVPKQSILLNADKVSFADVIAPRQLLQTKHTSIPNASVEVNLVEEMNKCCLLKEYKNDRVMRGLIGLCDGALEVFLTTRAQDERDEVLAPPTRLIEFRQLQSSKAYPANLIMMGQPFDDVSYAEVLRSGKVKGTSFVLPPLPPRLDVTFVLASNAKRLDLVLPGKFTLPITEASLKQIVEDRLSVDQRKNWTAFHGAFFEGVKLQFLFTSGVY